MSMGTEQGFFNYKNPSPSFLKQKYLPSFKTCQTASNSRFEVSFINATQNTKALALTFVLEIDLGLDMKSLALAFVLGVAIGLDMKAIALAFQLGIALGRVFARLFEDLTAHSNILPSAWCMKTTKRTKVSDVVQCQQ